MKKNIDNVHTSHRQRMRDRAKNEGLDSFNPHQILELLLYYTIPQKDTNELSHRLINEFGSLSGVFEADYEELIRINGIGETSAVLLNLIPQITRRYFKDKWDVKKESLNSVDKAGQYCISLLAGRTYEVFYVLCLDSQNKVSHAALAHEGTINEAAVYPRTIVEIALKHKSNSVILVHNHPGGSIKASNADIHVTGKIKAALNAISIEVLDHIIVGGNDYLSFAENGLL